MYNTLVPIYNSEKNYTEQELLAFAELLEKTKTDRAMLVVSRVLRNEEMLCKEIENFRRTKEFFENRGIKVGAWLVPSIGYGGTARKFPADNDADTTYTRIQNFSGAELYAYCPLDEAFVADFLNTLKAICSTGVDFVLFEDDFTITGGKSPEFGCCCDRHMAMYSKMLGREVSREEVKTALRTGGSNEIRAVWHACINKTLTDFAATIDREIHREYPNVRIGLSANSASYTLEGVEMPHLAKIIAGKNKPFIRLTGAPYWKVASSYATNMEAVRLQANWCGDEIETVSEGDTYPRPRHWVSAKHLELYDMVLQADGQTQGILKYMLDYTAQPGFETGYTERHCRNAKHYAEIARRFGNKQAVGLRVFENMNLYPRVTFSDRFPATRLFANNHLPTMSQELCVDNSIPTTYGASDGAAIAFGENGHFLTEEMLKKGVVLDATSALILHNRGIDVGFADYAEAPSPTVEYFRKEDDGVAVGCDDGGLFYNFTLKENADILSEFLMADSVLSSPTLDRNAKMYPACYYYENGEGHRFLVYSFVAHTVKAQRGWTRGYFRNYYRQNQLTEQIARLQGRPLPAVCNGNPQLYILCKKDEKEMAVGLWNIYPDEVIDPIITLDKPYKHIDFYNCNGRLEGNRVILNRDIEPFDFAFFTVSE